MAIPASAQTPVSGIVNTYYEVTDVVPSKACVIVTNPAGLNHNDKVMLIQMKGASINTTASSSTFGDTSNLNNAGNYEMGRVCAVIDDSVFLVFMILNQYTVADKVQLVKIPQYVSAIVTDTLKPAPWDNTTGTGGIVAISVEEDLILNAPIYADSSGFQGGEYRLSDGTCGNSFFPPPANAFAYNANVLNPQNGAFKGESVADLAPGISGGKGAPANGGGGGNNHNNGGGGGANLTAGGIGGGNSSSIGCTVTNQGRAGKALNTYGGSKIFFGGGGGAGHSNFTIPNQYGGGNGGGIVFIEAGNIVGNNMKISASGRAGGHALGDGASGGGAGGTIIMSVNSYTGTLSVESNGGAGGLENNNGTVNRCYGAGGGGSGGAIYFSGAAPPITYTVDGGNAGNEIGRSGCNPMVPAGAGAGGVANFNYTYTASLILENSYCAELLPVELISFKATYRDGTTLLKWQIAQPETALNFSVERSGDGRAWKTIQLVHAHPDISDYEAADKSPMPKTNFYRLKMTDIEHVVSYSTIQKIFIPPGNEPFKIYPNPARNKVLISGNQSFKEIILFDISGKLLWKNTITSRLTIAELDLPELPDGIYFIKAGPYVKKLSISK